MIKGRQRYEGMNYLSGDSTKDSTELFIKLQASWLCFATLDCSAKKMEPFYYCRSLSSKYDVCNVVASKRR